MNVTVQIATRRTGVPHARTLSAWANAACPRSRGMDLVIRVVGAAESRMLNRTWRGKDKPTNVLSFPAGPLAAGRGGQRPSSIGDLAVCAPVVAREAREQGKAARAHWAHMVVHGVLHLMGYDHENERDAARMEAAEVKILSRFGYPDPYA